MRKMKESNLSKTFLPIWQKKNGKNSHLFRNNTGAWKDKFNRWTFYGVGLLRRKNKKSPYRPVGGGDLIGWTAKTICDVMPTILIPSVQQCCNMVCADCRLAIFTSIELKTKGIIPTQDQKDWKKLVEKSGGIAEIVKEGDIYINKNKGELTK